MLKGFGLRSALKVGLWLSVWSKHDPRERHLPEAQRRRVGRQLMERYCAELDISGIPGYLETDRLENVHFYNKFGFDVTGIATIGGVDNYFMHRS